MAKTDLGHIELITADAIKWARQWQSAKFNLVFGSPPYENCRSYNRPKAQRKGAEWVAWMVEVYRECLRICDGLVAFVVEGKTENFRWSATPALLQADLHRAGIHLRKPPAFGRVGIPGSGGPDWLRNDYEFIVCATNGGKLPWSDNTAMGHPPKWAPGGAMSNRLADGRRKNGWEKGRAGRRNQWGGSVGHKVGPRGANDKRQPTGRPSHFDPTQTNGYDPPVLANPGNVIHCNVGGGLMGSKLAHENEAPFPEELAEFFVRSFCPPNGWVLDPFSGSGTTMAACRKFGRNGVGLDNRASQTKLAKRRLAE